MNNVHKYIRFYCYKSTSHFKCWFIYLLDIIAHRDVNVSKLHILTALIVVR